MLYREGPGEEIKKAQSYLQIVDTIYRAVEESEYSVPGKKSKTGEINKLEWVLSFQGV
ncbi:hypothetical protein [Butyrivibrio sp. AE3006]|uniref:hypothetical protein n=1 Tax=Butyrivibrio sp. AE3006 TaxID=1280673 RepID=UPI000412C0C9|nr:hypothetical protein [Butyrivibrio sp. AE3006]